MSSPSSPHLSTKTWLHPTACKLQRWMPQTKQLARQKHSLAYQKNNKKNETTKNMVQMTVCVLVAESCPILCNPIDCSPPGSSVHGIFQARILEWVDISFSRGIFPTRGLNLGLLHCRQSPAQSKHCRQSPVQFQLSPAQVKHLIS